MNNNEPGAYVIRCVSASNLMDVNEGMRFWIVSVQCVWLQECQSGEPGGGAVVQLTKPACQLKQPLCVFGVWSKCVNEYMQ